MRYCLIAAVLMLLAGSALAVAPANWTHSSEADFAGGEFKSTVLSSTGELALSRQVSMLMPSSAELTTVSAVATDGKAVYAGSGTSGMVYRIEGGKSSKWATVPGTIVTSLVCTGKELLTGSGGDGAGLYAIDSAGKVARRWSDANVKYVWAILPVGDDKIYLGTGPEAAIYAISVDGKSAAVVFKDGKWAKNVLCLAASKDGMIYAGTDENGLVFEINPVKNESRVILDAEEKEISSIVVDSTGGVFAATCDADKAEGGEEGEGAAAERITATRARPTPSSRPSMRSEGPERGKDNIRTATTSPATPPKSPTPRSFSDGATTTAPARPAATQPRPPSPAAMTARARAAMAARARGPQPAPVSELTGPGNAVYYIAPDGLVRCIFRKPVTILSMIELGGKLILGTGNGGTIYAVTREGRQYVQLVNTDAKQVTSLIAGGDGRIIFATANKGSVAMIGGELAKEGTYTSKALDAQQISKWGTARLRAAAPVGTAVAFSTRSGNIGEVDDKTWSAWSKPAPVSDGFLQITSPAARFLQYRIAFTSSGSTGSPPRAESRGGKAAPSVNLVDILYQTGNLPPTVQDIAVKSSTTGRENEGPDATGPQYFRVINITATDNNNDQLVYKIEFRAIGSIQWIELADKQEAPMYVWDTRTVGDGTYELRVTASDSPSNPPASALTGQRLSSPVIVDNTPPVVSELAASVDGRKISATGSTVDAGSRIASINYSVDSQSEWVAVLPTDGICDSPAEAFAFKTDNLKVGAHRIAVKVEDVFGNAGYGVVTVTIAKATTQPVTRPTTSTTQAIKPN